MKEKNNKEYTCPDPHCLVRWLGFGMIAEPDCYSYKTKDKCWKDSNEKHKEKGKV